MQCYPLAMPELPEVETVARQLASLRGRRVRRLAILDRRLSVRQPAQVQGLTVDDVFRLGKQVVLALRQGRRAAALWLAVHLRMTGRLVWTAAGQGSPPGLARARLLLEGGELTFVDTRRFGTLRLRRSLARLRPAGIDPFAVELSAAVLARLLAPSRQAIKVWLLRQDRLVGVGNIYASEILHVAEIDPRRPGRRLSPQQVGRLHRALRRVLSAAIRACGTTFSDFQDARGRPGTFQRRLAVYGRAGESCRRCGSAIERIVQATRSTFFCPGCQR
jgi:formamidopyrimidine-DNA glycosylase